MEGISRNVEACPLLLDLMPNNGEWLLVKKRNEASTHAASEEQKLELRLGPPGTGVWSNHKQDHSSSNTTTTTSAINNQVLLSPWTYPSYKKSTTTTTQLLPKQEEQLQPSSTGSYLQSRNKNLPFLCNDSNSQQPTSCAKAVADLQDSGTNKALSSSVSVANTAVPSGSQKRTAPGPVVGWPPIRSFRKNLTSSSSPSKPSSESQNVPLNEVAVGKGHAESSERKGMFVKINMDGVPIGRKVDLTAYDSYEKLSAAVDELFRGLLAAQKDFSAGGIDAKQEEEKPITGVLDGRGEYTLVYEDNEGDRILVGDVPWHMFISTVKRLWALKSSELSALSLGGSKLMTKKS